MLLLVPLYLSKTKHLIYAHYNWGDRRETISFSGGHSSVCNPHTPATINSLIQVGDPTVVDFSQLYSYNLRETLRFRWNLQ